MAKAEPTISVASRRRIADNKVWNVYFARVVEDTRETPDYLVLEPKHKIAEQVTGVCIIPVTQGRIGLVRIFRVAMNDVVWEAPKGFVDEGELAVEAALRELAEETGLACEARDVIPLGSVTPEASTIAARVKIFAALDCRAAYEPEDEIGMRSIRFHSRDEALAMAADSRIEDATTVVGIYRYISAFP